MSQVYRHDLLTTTPSFSQHVGVKWHLFRSKFMSSSANAYPTPCSNLEFEKINTWALNLIAFMFLHRFMFSLMANMQHGVRIRVCLLLGFRAMKLSVCQLAANLAGKPECWAVVHSTRWCPFYFHGASVFLSSFGPRFVFLPLGIGFFGPRFVFLPLGIGFPGRYHFRGRKGSCVNKSPNSLFKCSFLDMDPKIIHGCPVRNLRCLIKTDLWWFFLMWLL